MIMTTFRLPLCTTCTTACTAASLWWSSSCCARVLSRTSTSTMCATPSSSSAPHSQLLHSQVKTYHIFLVRYKKIECSKENDYRNAIEVRPKTSPLGNSDLWQFNQVLERFVSIIFQQTRKRTAFFSCQIPVPPPPSHTALWSEQFRNQQRRIKKVHNIRLRYIKIF